MSIVARRWIVSGATLALWLTSGPASAQTLQWLGAANTAYRNGANVSADGSTVAYRDASENARRWTAATGSQLLGVSGRATGVSGDGTTVVGTAAGVYTFGHAWRWTESGGLEVMPISPSAPTPAGAYATGISSDGRVSGNASAPYDAPAYWDPTGAQTEIAAAGADYQTTNIARDGSVIVGVRVSGACGQQCAMRWDASGGGYTGPTSFATNPSPGFGVALATSNGGTVIVGVDSTNDLKGWAWSQATNAVLLDTGGYADATAYAVSGDGSLIVGHLTSGNPVAAAWAGVGAPARTLAQLLQEDYGYSLGADVLQLALDVSEDGRVIVGKGLPGGTTTTHVFRLELPADEPPGVPGLGVVGGGLAAGSLLLAGMVMRRLAL